MVPLAYVMCTHTSATSKRSAFVHVCGSGEIYIRARSTRRLTSTSRSYGCGRLLGDQTEFSDRFKAFLTRHCDNQIFTPVLSALSLCILAVSSLSPLRSVSARSSPRDERCQATSTQQHSDSQDLSMYSWRSYRSWRQRKTIDEAALRISAAFDPHVLLKTFELLDSLVNDRMAAIFLVRHHEHVLPWLSHEVFVTDNSQAEVKLMYLVRLAHVPPRGGGSCISPGADRGQTATTLPH